MSDRDNLQFPYLADLPTKDLISLLAGYVRAPQSLRDADAQFIKEIQAQLKTRKDVGQCDRDERLELEQKLDAHEQASRRASYARCNPPCPNCKVALERLEQARQEIREYVAEVKRDELLVFL